MVYQLGKHSAIMWDYKVCASLRINK